MFVANCKCKAYKKKLFKEKPTAVKKNTSR